MSITRLIKPSFTGGEYSPEIGARVDLERYRTGLKIAKNVIIHPQGGVSNRGGTAFKGHTAQDGLTVQRPFVANEDTGEVYMLFLSANQMQFARNGIAIYEEDRVFDTQPQPENPNPPPDPDPEPVEDFEVNAMPTSTGAFGSPNEQLTSGPVTVNITGGEAPYVIAWRRVGGSPGSDNIVINSPAAQTTTFTSPTTPTAYIDATFVADVTDANSNLLTTNQVTIFFYRENFDNGTIAP